MWARCLTTVAYEHVFHNSLILSGYGNTILYTLIGTSINLVMTIMAAFPLSQKTFGARKGITFLFTFTMLFSGGLVPTFLTVQKLGLVDTIWALVLPGAISAWNMLIMKNYFQTSIPGELYEAARIDGSGEFSTFNRIVLPILKPALAVQAIFTFVNTWNNYFTPALVLSSSGKKTLPILIAQLRSADFLKFDMGQVYMMVAIAILPVIAVYLCLSKFIVRGVALGGVKG